MYWVYLSTLRWEFCCIIFEGCDNFYDNDSKGKTLSFFKDLFKSKKYIFSDLKPADRIHKVIETYIFPDLEKIGFKMSKSPLTLTRKVGDFKQEIYFSKNKWNNGNNVVSFDLYFGVTSSKYVKWHNIKYGSQLLNDSILGSNAYSIPNWSHEYFKDRWYDLAKDDNMEIIKYLKSNIEKIGLPYLELLSDKQSVIDFIIGQNSYYYTAPMLFDFAFMLNDRSQAEKILTWFNDYKNNSDSIFKAQTLKDVEIRQEILNTWE
jgi:hypothetical protein